MTSMPEWLPNLEILTAHLNDLRELEEARRIQSAEERSATLEAYLDAKQVLLNKITALTKNGWLGGVEDRLTNLQPRETAAFFLTVWERVKSLLAEVLKLHDHNLDALKQESQELGRTMEALGQSLKYLRAYPLNRQQSVRVNIVG